MTTQSNGGVYRPFPSAPPLCFLKVQKTGSASIRPWLVSMFPVAEVSPHHNVVEVEAFGEAARRYRLYAGHILGGQLDRVAPDAELFTILRDPAEAAISRYHFRRNVSGIEPDLATLARDRSLVELATDPSPVVLEAFRDQLTRQLGATWSEDIAEGELSGSGLEATRARQRARADAVLGRQILIGDHRDIEGATLLLAALRGWPAPPPRPRIHDYKAPTRSEATDPAVRAVLEPLLRHDYDLYRAAQPQIAAVRPRLAALCGEPTPQAVDAHHRRRFFAETLRLGAFRATADAGWSGGGWGARESDGLGNLYRQMTGPRATTLIRLDPEPELSRTIDLEIWNAGSEDALDGLGLQVSGAPLAATGRSRRGLALVLHWELPGVVVRAHSGDVEVGLMRAEAGAADQLWFSAIGCRTEGDPQPV